VLVFPGAISFFSHSCAKSLLFYLTGVWNFDNHHGLPCWELRAGRTNLGVVEATVNAEYKIISGG
jgi:hypothetical protein